MKAELTAQAVEDLTKSCLSGKGEGGMIVQAVAHSFEFDFEKVNAHRAQIQALLALLPDSFMDDAGGGMSFLQMNTDRDGRQWSGFHLTMESLVALGLAAELVRFPAPREDWSSLPGGLPFVTVLRSKFAAG